jgi:2-polyprenyl-3-methyl-5-hydroxy-6-metoxy-1,4-benzoquinol methylase
MRNILFLIFKNPKLDFLDSYIYVYDFIKKRLNFFSDHNIEFIDKCDQKDIIENFCNKSDFIVVIDSCNPITDFDMVLHMIESLDKASFCVAIPDGAVPGTQVEYIINSNIIKKLKNHDYFNSINVRCFSQDKYNNQFNLFKYKRLKLFLLIIREIKNSYKMSINEFIQELEKEELFHKLVSFAENVELKKHINCPHCKGDIVSIPMTMSQSFCGYIPSSKPLYNECQVCGLVIMSPYIEVNQIHKIYDNFDKEDFVLSSNNPYHKLSARCDFNDIISLLPKKTRSLDIGGGIGNFSKFLKEYYPNWEITHSDFAIKENRELNKLNIKTRSINFLEEQIGINLYDLITAWEVLEHIPYEKLSDTLDNIYNSLSNNGIFMFSTPNFDSPLCKHNDFFAICQPFHYLVFGKKWIENFFKNNNKWEILSIRHCSDFLDDSTMWYDYASKTSPSMQLRATSILLKNLLESETNKKLLLEKGYGTEIIVTLLKK